jgi:hypothetical protein
MKERTRWLSLLKSTGSHSIDGDAPLLRVPRDVLGMTGTKFGCGITLCRERWDANSSDDSGRSPVSPQARPKRIVGVSDPWPRSRIISRDARAQRAWSRARLIYGGANEIMKKTISRTN